jgi:flavin reductase (DIM6/NTAB) family NADH-FMN oxidoreductase RutF
LFATKKSQEEKFAETPYRLEHGAPVINASLGYIVCELDSELRRGDHLIAIGRVLGGDFDETAEPLLFYRSAYATLPQPADV